MLGAAGTVATLQVAGRTVLVAAPAQTLGMPGVQREFFGHDLIAGGAGKPSRPGITPAARPLASIVVAARQSALMAVKPQKMAVCGFFYLALAKMPQICIYN